MKKFIAILFVFGMLVFLSAAAIADDGSSTVKTLSWITAKRGLTLNEIEGGFYEIQDFDMDIWIPDFMTPQEEIPDDCYYVFENQSKTGYVKVHRIGFDNGECLLSDIEETITDLGSVSAGVYWINGYNALIYETKEINAISVVIPDDNCDIVEFVFSPMGDPDFYSLYSLLISTIQPHRLSVKDVALMMDADLNSTWGPNKEVRYAEDGSDITVYMWEEGMTSETFKNINNWDAVRTDKINTYNFYVDVLVEFGMNSDVLLSLLYISPDEDLSFLTISGGEIKYDAGE